MKVANYSLIAITNFFGVILISWPLFISDNAPLLRNLSNATWLSLGLSIFAVAILFSNISAKLLDSKTVALVAVLVALIAALRLLGAGAIGLEPMWFLLIIAARALGIELGYVIAIVAMTLSALITGGIGPWLPFQILIASWIALGVAVIPSNLTGKLEILTLSFYGFCVGLLYGALMDLQLWPWLLGTDTQLSYQPGAAVSENLARFLTFHFATALAWDLPRAILNSLLIALAGSSVLFALRRANSRMSAVAQWRQINERAKAQTES